MFNYFKRPRPPTYALRKGVTNSRLRDIIETLGCMMSDVYENLVARGESKHARSVAALICLSSDLNDIELPPLCIELYRELMQCRPMLDTSDALGLCKKLDGGLGIEALLKGCEPVDLERVFDCLRSVASDLDLVMVEL